MRLQSFFLVAFATIGIQAFSLRSRQIEPVAGLKIGDKDFCLTGTSFCCVSHTADLRHQGNTICTLDALDGAASTLPGCENVNGGKSVCCTSGPGGYCKGMAGLVDIEFDVPAVSATLSAGISAQTGVAAAAAAASAGVVLNSRLSSF